MTEKSALRGIRILDLSRLLPGPFCTLLFADLGAEVIKVEEPVKGDYNRHYRVKIGEYGASFLALNRGKKSVTLNLKHREGPVILKKLAKGADVLLEGFRPGVMDRLGVGYDAMKEVNPRLVYCSLSGYGQTGPYRDYPGHDINYMGYAGASSLTGRRGEDPRLPGLQIADIGGGASMAAFSILAALLARNRSGKGQHVDVSMMDGVAFWEGVHFASVVAGGETPARGEMRLNGGAICYNIYKTKDGRHVTMGALEKKFWNNFCELVERPDLIGKAYAEGEERDIIEEEIRDLFLTRSRDEWMELLAHEDVCFGPVNTLEEAMDNPQLQARGMFIKVPLPGDEGEMPQVGPPVKFSGTPANPGGAPPGLGQHNDEIYSSLGYNTNKLLEDGVI